MDADFIELAKAAVKKTKVAEVVKASIVDRVKDLEKGDRAAEDCTCTWQE